MKIAILTQPLSNNYGGLLQAYALQAVLKSMGHEPVILNRDFNYPPVTLILAHTLSLCKCIIRRYILKDKKVNIANPLNRYYTTDRMGIHDDSELKLFVRQNINQTRPIRSTRLLKAYARLHHFDCFIVGSDQVWRENYSPCITNYFLGFLPKLYKAKKVAYAASFGVEHDPISSGKLPQCAELAKDFDAISVREQSGTRLVKELFDIEATQVLDPTMLLDAKQYRKLIKEEDLCQSGLVSYVMDESEENKKIIHSVQSRLKPNQYTELLLFPSKGRYDFRKMASVSQWLAAFHEADFIVTDSFHGCVFSILFNKPFIAIGNTERGISRFSSLLGNFGLNDRLVMSHADFELRKEKLLTLPDFAVANSKLKTLKKESFNFLQRALN